MKAYPNWLSFIEAVAKPPCAEIDRPSSIYASQRFTGTGSYDEAMGLAKGGWADGLDKVNAEFRKLRAALPSGEQIAGRFAESGDEADVGLFLEGDPENMVEYVMEPRQRPVIKLVVSLSISASVDTEVIFRRGAAVMAVIDALEDAGQRVEVEVDLSAHNEKYTWAERIMVKSAESPMDRDRLVFALCHPSMLRRLCFRLHEIESLKEWMRRGGSLYGSPKDPEAEEGACVIPMMAGRVEEWSSTEAAIKECERIIAELSEK